MDGNIIHGVVQGSMREEHVAPIFGMFEKLMNAMPGQGDDYFFIFDVSKVKEVNRRSRKLYFATLKQWYRRHPFKAYILCGAHPLLRAAGNLISPLAPFIYRNFKDVSSARKFIANIKVKDRVSQVIYTQPAGENHDPEQDQIQKYIGDLLHFLGNINWETDGLETLASESESHPLSPIYDALRLIKMDLDEMARERKENEKALRESERKYRTILDTIADGYYEVDLNGDVTFCNQSLCRILGHSVDELKYMNYRQFTDEKSAAEIRERFRKIYETGQPCEPFQQNHYYRL